MKHEYVLIGGEWYSMERLEKFEYVIGSAFQHEFGASPPLFSPPYRHARLTLWFCGSPTKTLEGRGAEEAFELISKLIEMARQ